MYAAHLCLWNIVRLTEYVAHAAKVAKSAVVLFHPTLRIHDDILASAARGREAIDFLCRPMHSMRMLPRPVCSGSYWSDNGGLRRQANRARSAGHFGHGGLARAPLLWPQPGLQHLVPICKIWVFAFSREEQRSDSNYSHKSFLMRALPVFSAATVIQLQ